MPSLPEGGNTSVADLLEQATFPYLRQLKVTLLAGVDDLRQIQALSHSGPTLESVAMDLGNLSSLRLLLAHTPSVTELELEVDNKFPHNLSAISTVLESNLLPRLESFQNYDPPDYEAGRDALVKMLHARCTNLPGRQVLRSVTVVLPRQTSVNAVPFTSLARAGVAVTVQGYGVGVKVGGNVDSEDGRAQDVPNRRSRRQRMKDFFQSVVGRRFSSSSK
ncbi:hypothetical protein DFH07DRAFT_956488 [Mycena maculata]|uniref:Uncharacterized protein n=1 Tax=Mycena maculata TaxID=230809 RepID=A0AAD7JEC9_9AGAR|nr:hypothetical protein DFH07DRAFT_956488 [Mycena maculata]